MKDLKNYVNKLNEGVTSGKIKCDIKDSEFSQEQIDTIIDFFEKNGIYPYEMNNKILSRYESHIWAHFKSADNNEKTPYFEFVKNSNTEYCVEFHWYENGARVMGPYKSWPTSSYWCSFDSLINKWMPKVIEDEAVLKNINIKKD